MHAEKIHAVLGHHEYALSTTPGVQLVCTCGYGRKPGEDETLQDIHKMHVSEVLALALCPSMTFYGEQPPFTLKEVAESIGWLDGGDSEIEYSSVSWARVDETGLVHLEGRDEGAKNLVDVTVKIVEVNVRPDDSQWEYDEDEEDEDDG